jgi:hypothetical protein
MTIFNIIELLAWLIVVCVIAVYVYKASKIPDPTYEQLKSWENVYKAAEDALNEVKNESNK